MFPQQPCTELKAQPDFSSFQFVCPAVTGTTVREVRFLHQKETDIYNLDICLSSGDDPCPDPEPSNLTDTDDGDFLMTTLLLIIELYTERFPDRVIRLKGNTREKARLYRAILNKHVDLLIPHFAIDIEQDRPLFFLRSRSRESIDHIAFLIRRRPGICFTIHTVRTTLNSRSLLFHNIVSVELYRNIHVGMVQFENTN